MERKTFKVKDIIDISIMTVVIIACSFITIPMFIPFTLQLLAIFLTLLYLGPYKGLISIIVYVFLGIIGIPVFSSFQGGIGVILGPTGGFIIGFVVIGILYLLLYKTCHEKDQEKIGLLFFLLIFLYIFGYFWIGFVYTDLSNVEFKVMLLNTIKLLLTTGGYLFIFDVLKLILAFVIYKKIKKISKA